MLESSRPRQEEPGAWAAQMAAHEGLVRWVVRQQWRGGLPFEEALHAGRIGLWGALRRYDPARGTRFSTYAVPAIQHAVWAAVAAQHPAPPPVLTERGGPAGESTDPVEVLHQAQVRAALRELVRQLPPRWRQIVVAHYGLERTPPQSFAAIGHRLGISRQRVHQLHTLALGYLAHPARSLALRRLVGRHGRADYQQALARQHQRARARRHRGRGQP